MIYISRGNVSRVNGSWSVYSNNRPQRPVGGLMAPLKARSDVTYF